MDQHALPVIKPHQNVFGATTKPQHHGTLQRLGKPGGEREAHVRPMYHRTGDSATVEPGLKAAHHGFNFWEFRHDAEPYT